MIFASSKTEALNFAEYKTKLTFLEVGEEDCFTELTVALPLFQSEEPKIHPGFGNVQGNSLKLLQAMSIFSWCDLPSTFVQVSENVTPLIRILVYTKIIVQNIFTSSIGYVNIIHYSLYSQSSVIISMGWTRILFSLIMAASGNPDHELTSSLLSPTKYSYLLFHYWKIGNVIP